MSIFTGNINLLCTSNMMIAMVLFACVSPLSLTPPHVARTEDSHRTTNLAAALTVDGWLHAHAVFRSLHGPARAHGASLP